MSSESSFRNTVLKAQRWLNHQPMEILGGMLAALPPRSSCDDAERVVYDQILIAMMPVHDAGRERKVQGVKL